MKKKALEPLIATILLIVVAVILVTIVLAWGRNFTGEGLNRAARVMEDNCSGAAIIISDCQIMSDGNIVFQVKNIGANYSFLSTDAFKIMLIANTGKIQAETNLTFASNWNGLDPGQSVMAKFGPTLTDINTMVTSTTVDVMIRSSVCPHASTKYMNCHR